MATKRKKATRKKKAESQGLFATQLEEGTPPNAVAASAAAVDEAEGRVLSTFKDPLGGRWQMLVALPIRKVRASAFQRDLSDAHVKKLMSVIDRIGRYLDPVVVVPDAEGGFRTPNGHHRLEALRRLGARTVLALLVPETELEYQILALNTEKAPGLKDRALESIRLARALAKTLDPNETDFELQFEEAAHLTLGLAYESRARLAGSVYHPILRKCDAFIEAPLSETLPLREARSAALLDVDDRVQEIVRQLTARGFDSPYLKTFVVARINPVRSGKTSKGFDEVIEGMRARAAAFEVEAVDASQIGP